MPKRIYDQELTPNQRKAAHLLGTGETRAAAAAAVGVKEGTIYSWLHNPAFCAERDKVCDNYVSEVVPMAVSVFIEQMCDTRDKSAWLRQNAAGRLLALMDKRKESADKVLNVVLSGDLGAPGMPASDDGAAATGPAAEDAGECAKSPPDA